MHDFHGKTPEGLEVAVAGQGLPDPGTADLQNIGLGQQLSTLQGLSKGSTEAGAIIQVDVDTVAAADVDLQRHRSQMREQLDAAEFKALISGHGCGQGLEFRKQGMRQWKLRSGQPDVHSVVADLPRELRVGHKFNVSDGLTNVSSLAGQWMVHRGKRRPSVQHP